jgi:hypothetical protein
VDADLEYALARSFNSGNRLAVFEPLSMLGLLL